ncbi:ankyrin repeat domain-containing protein [Actinomadura sp. SCN-SB]|uniref:ankyrin repeat domain-containing protein n=1 Tax=Actinomadura sp. SCN-SB TaxID=3373092 RepID=UPI00375252AF
MPQGNIAAGSRLARLRRIRRYAVPRWMIERATERRLAGDWRGACAAAAVDVTFDLDDIAARYGAEVAAAVEDDLLHLAPDLVRWHAPRVGPSGTTLQPGGALILNHYGAHGLEGRAAPRLYITAHPWLFQTSQRLTLYFAPVDMRRDAVHMCDDYPFNQFWRGIAQSWVRARHLWDVRRAHELRRRCGGDDERVPFLEPDGTPRAAAKLPTSDPGADDPVGHAEWVTMLHERGEVEAAFTAAGIALEPESVEYQRDNEVGSLDRLARMPLALTRLEPELRRAPGRPAARFAIPCGAFSTLLLEHDGDRGVRAEMGAMPAWDYTEPVLAEARWQRLPDIDLLREGRTPPEWLHPLVHDALCPARPSSGVGPPEPERPDPVRVRCRGDWHEVAFEGGALRLPHSAEERKREEALAALGGAVGGCFAVQKAWRTGAGRLPKALRDQRRDLFDRAHHGDTPGVLRLLDLGVDPRVRDKNGRTLLHKLYMLDHEVLLPRLLAAGLDVDTPDVIGASALHRAVELDGSVALVRALLDAGARIDLVDKEETTIPRLIYRAGRKDLGFLEELIAEEYPHLLDY